jgi:methyl-accepting chemotaxis protein
VTIGRKQILFFTAMLVLTLGLLAGATNHWIAFVVLGICLAVGATVVVAVQRVADTLRHLAVEMNASDEATPGSAGEMAGEGPSRVREANQAVGRMIASLQEIDASGEQVSGMIDELAFQTSLLALNAAVEAAPAEEVRNLEQRSAQAAQPPA